MFNVSRLGASVIPLFISYSAFAASFVEKPLGDFGDTLPKVPNVPPPPKVPTPGDLLEQGKEAATDGWKTYTKGWVDGAEEGKRALNDGADAVKAVAKFTERQTRSSIDNAEKVAQRAREGKFADAAWHWTTDNYRSTEKNAGKATEESKWVDQAAGSAAAVYGGPGGAAAYASWKTYRATGDPTKAFQAGLLAAATSQAGAATSKMPAGTLGEVVKKAAVAGAAGGLAVAAAGGDEKAIRDGFLKAGGAVVIQRSTDAAKAYSPKAADAVQIIDCVSARDAKCLSKTTYMRSKGKLLTDKYGKPIEKAIRDNETVGRWSSDIDKATLKGQKLARIVDRAKLPGTQTIPVMGDKFVLTWTLGQTQKVDRAAVVLTQVGNDPPFRTVKPVQPAAKPSTKKSTPTTAVYICPVDGFNRTVTVTPFGRGCKATYQRGDREERLLWRSDRYRNVCMPEAVELVRKLRNVGVQCRRVSGTA
ncbi:hypothetical protein ACSFA0_14840 [Variovorax sp. LT1P1]|uniref:hypothetical protein n=1 Tax=Variovorax sp. LT1P1 TaxID=3443730 RepID=UPI003F482221